MITRVLPRILIALACAVHVVVLVQSLVFQRFWEDEALNFSVPSNLLAGLGYTSDGTLSGSELIPFDVRVSTGPVVLLPVTAALWIGNLCGVDPAIAARVVPALFWVLLITGTALIGRRIAGSWGALAGLVVPLALNTRDSVSPIQGPADLLGEVAAAALLVWAVVLLQKRPALAGLIFGLAIQAKFIALLAAPALVIGLLVAHRLPLRRWIGALWLPVILAAVPTGLYWLWMRVALGWDGFRDRAYWFRDFLLWGGQDIDPVPVAAKIGHFAEQWFVPAIVWWVAVAIAVVLLVGLLFARCREGRNSNADGRSETSVAALLWTAAIGVVTFLAWWATASNTPLWIRHPAPGILAFAPILAAGVVLATRRQPRLVRAAFGIALVALLAVQVVGRVDQTLTPPREILQDQRAAADVIGSVAAEHELTWLAAEPWGSAVSIAVMSGAHAGLSDAPAMAGHTTLRPGPCAEGQTRLVESGGYSLCSAPVSE